MNQQEKIDQFLKRANKNTTWKDLAVSELENRNWMDRSAAIAVTILDRLNTQNHNRTWLADQIGVSRQYLSKVLKGRENLTLGTISKLETALGMEILEVRGHVPAEFDYLEFSNVNEYTGLFKSNIEFRNFGNKLSFQMESHKVSQDYKMEIVYTSSEDNELNEAA